MEKLRIVVSGFIGSFCISGITWHYAQYLAGLHKLGHDVYYVEDTCGVNCYYDPSYEWGDPTPIVNYLEGVMNFFGMNERWAYRDEGTGKYFGLPEKKLQEICATADVLISISNSIYLRDEYRKIPVRVLIDTDPMFTQTPGDPTINTMQDVKHSLLDYSHHFSYGENIMAADSLVPTHNLTWHPTRQPICLDYWKNEMAMDDAELKRKFTTILNLSSKGKFDYNNETWGQKDVELEKIIDLPGVVKKAGFELVMAGSSKDDHEHNWLKQKGWLVSDNLDPINRNLGNYQNYIQNSFAEFSVAKETYVKANTGWFSDRSACYLAAGRPVILQETQWSKYLPAGKGLLTFRDIETASQAVEEVFNHYTLHKKAAKEIALEYFDSNKVLDSLLKKIF